MEAADEGTRNCRNFVLLAARWRAEFCLSPGDGLRSAPAAYSNHSPLASLTPRKIAWFNLRTEAIEAELGQFVGEVKRLQAVRPPFISPESTGRSENKR